MRIMLIALATLLLLGCIAQHPENPVPAPNSGVPEQNQTPPHSQNETGAQTVPQNASLINESNITARNAGISNPGNATLSNGTNATAPVVAANATTQRPALRFGDYSLVLDDVSIVPSSAGPCGIFSIIAANGSMMDRFVACPRQSRMWIAPDGHAYRIFVVKVAAGYEGVEWADVTVFG